MLLSLDSIRFNSSNSCARLACLMSQSNSVGFTDSTDVLPFNLFAWYFSFITSNFSLLILIPPILFLKFLTICSINFTFALNNFYLVYGVLLLLILPKILYHISPFYILLFL